MAVTWAQAKCKGTGPSARAYHSMSCIGTKVFMFGGTGRAGGALKLGHPLIIAEIIEYHLDCITVSSFAPN